MYDFHFTVFIVHTHFRLDIMSTSAKANRTPSVTTREKGVSHPGWQPIL